VLVVLKFLPSLFLNPAASGDHFKRPLLKNGLDSVTVVKHFKTYQYQPLATVHHAEISDNTLIIYEKFPISFGSQYCKRFVDLPCILSVSNRHSLFLHPPVLQLMQLVIKSFLFHQLDMVAGFDNAAAVQYDDSMGIADG